MPLDRIDMNFVVGVVLGTTLGTGFVLGVIWLARWVIG